MEDVPLQGGTPGDRVGHDGRIRSRIPEEEEQAEGAAAPFQVLPIQGVGSHMSQ